jgi:hypothetical protein
MHRAQVGSAGRCWKLPNLCGRDERLTAQNGAGSGVLRRGRGLLRSEGGGPGVHTRGLPAPAPRALGVLVGALHFYNVMIVAVADTVIATENDSNDRKITV